MTSCLIPTRTASSTLELIPALQVYDNMNLGRRIDPQWPDPEWRARGGRNSWQNWIPLEGMEGPVVHRWTPCHAHPLHRYTTALYLANLQGGS